MDKAELLSAFSPRKRVRLYAHAIARSISPQSYAMLSLVMTSIASLLIIHEHFYKSWSWAPGVESFVVYSGATSLMCFTAHLALGMLLLLGPAPRTKYQWAALAAPTLSLWLGLGTILTVLDSNAARPSALVERAKIEAMIEKMPSMPAAFVVGTTAYTPKSFVEQEIRACALGFYFS